MATESCHNCAYAYWDLGQAMQSISTGFPSRPACANHPDSLGRMRPVSFSGVCRNYRSKAATPGGDVKRIPVGQGLYAYVDAADYEWLSQWTWHLNGGYAVRLEKGKKVFMHRQIMPPPPGRIVDHTNHNKLDNSRPNLRPCTRQENMYNLTKRTGSCSRFKGVGYRKDRHKWYALLRPKGRRTWTGSFDSEIEAARAYDRKAIELFGEFANLDFPEDWPPERRREAYAQRDAAKTDGRKAGRKKGKKDTAGRKKRKNPKDRKRTTIRKGRKIRPPTKRKGQRSGRQP
jgi:hypothetical protein